MNYMYGKGYADEMEAQEVVGKINRMIVACEPDVRSLVERKLPYRHTEADALRQLALQRQYEGLRSQNFPSGFQQQNSLASALGFGRIFP